MNSASVIARVKKLLALSQSANAHESAVALARANALIVQHRIDMVLLHSSDPAMPEPYGQETIECSRKRIEVKGLLEEHFNCKVVYQYSRGSGSLVSHMNVIGRQTDAEFGRWLVSYLRDEFMRRWKHFRQATGAATTEKNAFVYGMYKGLDERLRKEGAQAEEHHISQVVATKLAPSTSASAPLYRNGVAHLPSVSATDLAAKYAVAVQSEQQSLVSEVQRRYPDLRRGRACRLRFGPKSRAIAAGKASGRTISCNRPIGSGA